jgi:hypothetical protein
MNIKEWQSRLENEFLRFGPIGAELIAITKYEDLHKEKTMNNFHGFRALIHSFYELYIQSLLNIRDNDMPNKIPKTYIHYYPIFLTFVITFKNLRASEILFQTGYPLDAFSLLRDLAERALFLGAIINKYTSFRLLFGADAINEKIANDFKIYSNVISLRKKEEKKAINKMFKGIDESNLRELSILKKLLNEEVHSSRLSMLFSIYDYSQKNYLGPHFDIRTCALYMNRVIEICWMLLRALPFLQPKPGYFNVTWTKKWKLLDESFEFMINSFLKEDQKVALAIKELINKKFSFNPSLSYFESEF